MRWFQFSFLIVLVQSTLIGEAFAQEKLEQQRQWFSRAESIAHKPKSSEYKYLQQELQDYPLYPYVELKTLMRFPFLSNKDKIETFLDTYENTPMDRPLRKKWLNYLAKQKQSAMFLHFYRDIGDVALQCRNLRFRIDRDGFDSKIQKQIEKLWLVGKSQPKACDSIFKQWQDRGHRTTDIVWHRMRLAADGGNHTLIPYLKTLLPQEQQYLADLWLKVRRSPSYVSRVSYFPGNLPALETQILTYGLKRLIWRDRELALKTWPKLTKRFQFSQKQEALIAEKFAISLASKNHPKAGEWLNRANRLHSDPELHRWHLAHLLRENDWQQVASLLANWSPDKLESHSHAYWQSRSLAQLQAADAASLGFAQLAGNRHYYGFLASGQLAQSAQLDNKPLAFSNEQLQALSEHPVARRAREFLHLKRFVSARREWQYLHRELDPQMRLVAAVLADSWGWHDQAIRTFSKVKYYDDIARRFPLAYQSQLTSMAKRHNIDPAWAFAIARRESSFMADANSGAGAKGLMQVLPGTAKYLEKKRIKNRALFDPDTNVQIGTKYLRYLMDKMNENPVLATASYNAGWRRVKDWVPDAKMPLPMDIWVETIPFKETRNYVKAVLAYQQIYKHRLGQSQNMFQSLTDMEISKADFGPKTTPRNKRGRL